MAPRKEHVTRDCYVKKMELVQWHAQLMEDLEMALREVHAMKANCVKRMEHALQVCISNIFVQYYNYKCINSTQRE